MCAISADFYFVELYDPGSAGIQPHNFVKHGRNLDIRTSMNYS